MTREEEDPYDGFERKKLNLFAQNLNPKKIPFTSNEFPPLKCTFFREIIRKFEFNQIFS